MAGPLTPVVDPQLPAYPQFNAESRFTGQAVHLPTSGTVGGGDL